GCGPTIRCGSPSRRRMTWCRWWTAWSAPCWPSGSPPGNARTGPPPTASVIRSPSSGSPSPTPRTGRSGACDDQPGPSCRRHPTGSAGRDPQELIMAGNSQRKGAVRRRGKGNTAGSGGRIRRGLEGKGPTPKAEDRPYHKAHKQKAARKGRPSSSAGRRTGRPGSGPEWVVGRNPVLEALQAGIPVHTAYIAEGAERDDRLRGILKHAADHGTVLLEVTRGELDRLTGGAVHQGIA